MLRRPPRSTRTDTLLPYTTLFRSNVPAGSLERLARQCRVSPSAAAVSVAQDRIREKAFIQSMGVEVASYAPVLSMDDIDSAPDSLFPGILKAARLGYDGKGRSEERRVGKECVSPCSTRWSA